jgi:chemotaxis methyl-accepting protein methylase
MFGDCVWRVGGHSHDSDRQFLRGLEINIVEAGTSQGDESYSLILKHHHAFTVDSIVHKHAYDIASGGGLSCFFG